MASTLNSSIGPYRILRQLGRGGMGTVYLCQHRDLGIRRAVKVLNTDGSTTMLERFKREAQVEAALEHPHILKAEHYDLDQQGRPYVVMPYVGDDNGPMDLDRYLTEHGGKLDSATTARLTRQILDGLAHAHEQGLVHRDLKPANILIEEGKDGPTARIADFGLVRLVGEAAFRDRIYTSMSQSLSLGSAPTLAGERAPDEYGQTIPAGSAGTSTQALIGTWSYMAPEQKRTGVEVDHRADLYAAGLLAYRMLLGKLPEGITRLPGQIDPSLTAWDEWLARMLEGDIDARFQSAAEALAALPGRARVRQRSSRKPIGLMVGVLAVIALSVAGWQLMQQFPSWPGAGTNSNPSQPTMVQYDTAADLVAIEAEVRALKQNQLVWPDLGPIKQARTEGENAFQMAVANQDRMAWKAAGMAYERAKRAYERAVTLDAQAIAADEARATFHERYDPVTWFEHEAITPMVTEIKGLDALASKHWEAGEFTDAEAAWTEASRKATAAETVNASAVAAAEARQAFERVYNSVAPPWYSVVADDVDRLAARADSAKALFNKGMFDEASVAWSGAAEELGSLKQRHEKAQNAAKEARDDWSSALTGVPDPLYDKVRPGVAELHEQASEAEQLFEKGAFDEASVAWSEAAKKIAPLEQQHKVAQASAGQARSAWDKAKLSTPTRWIDATAVSADRVEAADAEREAESAMSEARFDAAVSSYARASSILNEAIALHDAALARLLRTAQSQSSSKERRKKAVEEYLTYKPADADAKQLESTILALFGPKRGDTKTLALGGGVQATLVWIEPGLFMMGSPSGESGRDSDENPQHRVTITKGFWLGQTEVTQGQWQAVMGNNPSGFTGNDDHPVERVSWNDAKSFCKRLSEQTGSHVRLPSEAEWEFACRAGTTTPFNTGNTISTAQANYNGNYTYGSGGKGVNRAKTMPVGSFSANAWGLYDMHGNVYEWCEDWYGDYPSGTAVDPTGPQTGLYRVLRGGSWDYGPKGCRSANRNWNTPDTRY